MNKLYFKCCIALIVFFSFCIFFATLREVFTAMPNADDSPSKTYGSNNINNLDIEYHMSEDQIREKEKHVMNLMYVKGDDGRPIGIHMEKTQSFPTYHTPGSFVHGSAQYVPTYEDAILLPLAK